MYFKLFAGENPLLWHLVGHAELWSGATFGPFRAGDLPGGK